VPTDTGFTSEDPKPDNSAGQFRARDGKIRYIADEGLRDEGGRAAAGAGDGGRV